MLIRFLFLFCSISFACGYTHKDNKNRPSVSDSSITDLRSTHVSTISQTSKIYNFQEPSKIFILDKKLSEVSGLSYDPANHLILANDDESGRFYKLDVSNLQIIDETKFAKKGDFESIEKMGNVIVICKNNGKLYFYDPIKDETENYKTSLRLQNDVEGLCFLKAENELLLACKGQPIHHKKGKKTEKCIYSFDLSTKQLDENPYLSITDEILKSYVNKHFKTLSNSDQKKLKNRVKDFAPSAIALHSPTGDLYISSAKGSTIVIYNHDKQLKDIIFLDENLIPQPEGLTFDLQNNLYIATEGHGFNGKIFKFEAKN